MEESIMISPHKKEEIGKRVYFSLIGGLNPCQTSLFTYLNKYYAKCFNFAIRKILKFDNVLNNSVFNGRFARMNWNSWRVKPYDKIGKRGYIYKKRDK